MITIETMKRFTKDASGKFDVENFYWHKGHLCATNGRVFIRVKFDEKPDVKYSEHFPDVDDLFSRKSMGREVSICMIQGGQQDCWECGGSCYRGKPCKTCGGEGEILCTLCNYTHECRECGGDGYVPDLESPCPICCAKGKTYSDYPINNKSSIAGGYISLISALPEAKFYIDDANSDKPIYFTFTGGDGLIMPKDRRQA